MSNLFRQTLLSQPKTNLKITFNSPEEYKEFIHALYESDSSNIKIPNYKSISYSINNNEKIHIDSNTGQSIFVDLKKLKSEEILLDKKQNIKLKLISYNSGLIETDPSKSIVIKIKMKNVTTAEIFFEANFSKAKNINQVFKDIQVLRKFIEVFINKPNENSESKKLFEFFDYWNGFFIRVKEIEEDLNVTFDLSKITDNNIFERRINMLYVGLIQCEAIKETRRLKNLDNLILSKNETNLLNKNQIPDAPTNLTNLAKENFEFLGTSITLYRVNYIMNVIITSAPINNEGVQEIHFKQPSDDYAPLCVYRLFKNETVARKELANFNNEKVASAKTLDDYISKL